MTAAAENGAPAVARPGEPWLPRRILAAFGKPVVGLARSILAACGMAWAIVAYACQPLTWRAPVRDQFMRGMYTDGVGGIRTAIISGFLFGLAMVVQAEYWLRVAGQGDLLGKVLVLLLVREIGPLIMGLIVVGRSGIAIIIDFSLMRANGQIRMLEAQGIDVFRFLVVPRVIALSLSLFCLTMVFVVTALIFGHLSAYLLGIARLSFYGFLDAVLRAMAPADFAVLPVKTVAIGLAIGIGTTLAGASDLADEEIRPLVARGFVNAVVAVFIVSGVISVML